MRQLTIEWYTAWINWSFDNAWVFPLGLALYITSLVLQRRARRGRWGK